MCVNRKEVTDVVSEVLGLHEKYVDKKFEAYKDLMEEKFNSSGNLMEEKFNSSDNLMEEKFKSNYYKTKSDFDKLNDKLDTFTTQESRINCIENKMLTKSSATTSLKIGISIIILGIGLVAYFI